MDRFKTFLIHLSLLFALFASASLTHADEELNIPQPLKHDGLTFEEVLPDGVMIESESTDSFQKIEFAANLDDVAGEPIIAPAISPTSPISPTILTQTPTPTPTIKPTEAPTATSQPTQPGANSSNGGLNADILFSMSNNYRAGKGLSPFQTDGRICALAAARAPQIASEIAGGHMHSGKNSHSFPYWFTENIITMRTEQEAFNWWVNDHIHRVQIEENNTHSCVACSGNACVQHFTSFKPK